MIVPGPLCSPTRHILSLQIFFEYLITSWIPTGKNLVPSWILNIPLSALLIVNKEGSSCMLHLVGRWLAHDTGTGSLPRTWDTVLHAVKEAGHCKLAMELAEKYGVTLTH